MNNPLEGRTIGGYRILRRLAVGGMGSVFLAAQPGTKREVALKILRPELLGPELLRRFSLEIEILGQLQHPGIARIFGGGEETLLSSRVPYFAMELVPDGIPIHEYAQQRNLSVPARLRLFLQVCAAVEHAHNRGIIHRDLKAENVLVDPKAADPHPKVIDFGIARQSTSRGTSLTTAGEILGSLESMSPEQAGGDSGEVDLRTDVYGLSAILYRVLTGRTPLPTEALPLSEAIRVVLETQPSPPSSHVGQLRPELDAIVLKGLAKRKDSRYESVRAFRDDILAYLDGRTVTARVPGTLDLLRRTISRYRSLLIPAAIVFLVALTTAIVSLRYAIRAERDAEVAEGLIYRTSLAAASRALQEHEQRAAEQFLSEAPPARRNWEWNLLSRRAATPSRTVGEPTWGVAHHLDLSPDGHHYAKADTTEGAVHVCSLKDGTQLASAPIDGVIIETLFGEPDYVTVLAARGEKRFFHRIGIDGTIVETWEAKPFPSRPTNLWNFSMVPGQSRVFGTMAEPGILFYDLAEKKLSKTIPTEGPFIFAPAFDSNGALVAVAERLEDGTFSLSVYDVSTSERRHRLVGPQDRADRAQFTSDGRYLLASCNDGNLYMWEPEVSPSPIHVFEGSQELLRFIAISSDDRLVATTSPDGRLLCWEIPTRRLIATYDTGTLVDYGIEFQPGTHTLFTAGDDGLRAWDFSDINPSLVTEHASYVYPVELAENSGVVVTGGWDGHAGEPGCLRWTDLETGEPRRVLGPPGSIVLAAAMSPNEDELLASIYVPHWAGEEVDTTNVSELVPQELRPLPDTGFIARISMATGEVLQALVFPKPIHFVATDPKFRRAVLGDRVGQIRVIDLADGSVLHETEEGIGEARDRSPVAWSPDGRWIGVALGQNQIEVWDAENYQPVGKIQGHTDWIWSLSFNAEGSRLLTASNDQTVGVWSVPDGASIAKLEGHGVGVLCAKYHPSGDRIVAGARGGEAWVWDTADHQPLVSMKLHDSYIFDLEFTADGNRMVTSSGDGTVRIWDGSAH